MRHAGRYLETSNGFIATCSCGWTDLTHFKNQRAAQIATNDHIAQALRDTKGNLENLLSARDAHDLGPDLGGTPKKK